MEKQKGNSDLSRQQNHSSFPTSTLHVYILHPNCNQSTTNMAIFQAHFLRFKCVLDLDLRSLKKSSRLPFSHTSGSLDHIWETESWKEKGRGSEQQRERGRGGRIRRLCASEQLVLLNGERSGCRRWDFPKVWRKNWRLLCDWFLHSGLPPPHCQSIWRSAALS